VWANLDKYQTEKKTKKIPEESLNFVLDATFFGRNFGVLIARAKGKNQLWKFITTEKLSDYEELLDELIELGFKPKSFTIDGRKGVKKLLEAKFEETPIQHCHFHQSQTITKYLTRNPKLQASCELRELVLQITKTDRKTFTKSLENWFSKWENFLKEKTLNEKTGKYFYTHKKLRSAYNSLKTNLPYLFACLDFPDLKIPNTTNSCDGSFAHWKSKVKIHRGLSLERKKKMISYLLENC
jgi:hypothetical protein